jgi:polyvinyl alcohol dehydrogenase (cytochrome)
VKRNKLLSMGLAVLALGASIKLLVGESEQHQSTGQWTSANQSLSGNRNQADERKITASNVSSLVPKWIFTTGGDVAATPTVADNAVYFPDSVGNLYALNKNTGELIWSQTIGSYDGFPTAVSRVSPAIYQDALILGDTENPAALHAGANIMSVDRRTGGLKWITNVESFPAAIITGSPVVYRDTVYVGVSSNEESTLASKAAYPCCTFRGSVVALNANTGVILWKTYDVPDNHGATNQYSGGAIWQPPAIDEKRGVLYVGTGNNYTVPASVQSCQQTAQASHNVDADCTAPDDYFDAALALDLQTGQVRWSHKQLHDAGSINWDHKVEDYDAWTTGCNALFPVNCPSPKGADYDLGGAGPNLLDHMVGFGQKSGDYWAFDPDNGRVLWKTFVGPAGTGTLGGIEWGTASDGKRIYTEISDSGHVNYTLIPSGTTINWGSWSALDASTGKILWQTADPSAGAIDFGAVTISNGVMFAGSQAAAGNMYALDANTGKILWTYASGGSVVDGPSIVDGVVYWGSGYKIGTHNNKMYAFALPEGRR